MVHRGIISSSEPMKMSIMKLDAIISDGLVWRESSFIMPDEITITEYAARMAKMNLREYRICSSSGIHGCSGRGYTSGSNVTSTAISTTHFIILLWRRVLRRLRVRE